MSDPPVVERLRHTDGITDTVTTDDIQPAVERVQEYSWEIHYHGARCKFESPDHDTATIYDLNVPEAIQGRGIGTAMLTVAENTVREYTAAETLFASIGAPDEATAYVLREKAGFDILGTKTREGVGRVVEAEKQL